MDMSPTAWQVIHEGKTCKEYQDHLTRESEKNEELKQSLNQLKVIMVASSTSFTFGTWFFTRRIHCYSRQEMLEKGEAMKCPKCEVIIMKNGGCDGLQCGQCRIDLCWATKGPRWGPRVSSMTNRKINFPDMSFTCNELYDFRDEETRAEVVDAISCTAGHVIPTAEIVINVIHSTSQIFSAVKSGSTCKTVLVIGRWWERDHIMKWKDISNKKRKLHEVLEKSFHSFRVMPKAQWNLEPFQTRQRCFDAEKLSHKS